MPTGRIPRGAAHPRRRLTLALVLAGLAWALAGAARADDASAPRVRWYESLREGQKVGWTQVRWSASTWNGRATVHDHTESLTRSARDMAGHLDVFETRATIDLERDADGTLWWQRVEVLEAGRSTTVETTWTGAGYEQVTRLQGQEERVTIPTQAPVHTDAEALVSERARAGTLAPGTRLSLRSLDVAGRRVHESPVQVVGPETLEVEEGPVASIRIVVTHPETRSEDVLWIDAEGAFVKSVGEGGFLQQRVSEATARRLPARPPSFGITVPSRPALARVMSADRLWVDIDLAEDAARKLPDFPASPWGRVGPAQPRPGGWRFEAELTAYDAPGVTRPLPLDPTGFERDLEPTALMPCGHPDLKAAAEEARSGAADARLAAARLARWVHDSLEKESTDVAQASALQILEERKGDCSEHALLFVALCRALGIPARLCSGYVNIGPMWGAHAWAEIWVGAWIGADPTTGEIGTAARYLFFGYQDVPDSWPGVVSARIQGRIQLRLRALEEDGVRYDVPAPPAAAALEGPEGGGWWLHVPTGIEARGLPEGVRLTARDAGRVDVFGPGIKRCQLWAQADQGDDLSALGGLRTTFAGAPALSFEMGLRHVWLVHSRRRMIRVSLEAEDDAVRGALERMLAPGFAATVTDPRAPAPEPPGSEVWVGTWRLDRAATRALLEAELLAGLEGPARERALGRLTSALERLSVSLEVQASGAFGLARVRQGPGGGGPEPSPTPVTETAEGAWQADGAGLRLVTQAAGGELTARLADGRLVLRRGAEVFVLERAGAEAGR